MKKIIVTIISLAKPKDVEDWECWERASVALAQSSAQFLPTRANMGHGPLDRDTSID